MNFPDVIVLNGTSSSGKTSLAAALQETLEESYIHASIDAFWRIFPQKAFAPEVIEHTGLRGVAGFHRCIAALAGAGNRVIVDTMLADKKWAEDCMLVLHPYRTLYVSVQCPLEELERREEARGDRSIGLARAQQDRVHLYIRYDMEVNTLENRPAQCAAKIKQQLVDLGAPQTR